MAASLPATDWRIYALVPGMDPGCRIGEAVLELPAIDAGTLAAAVHDMTVPGYLCKMHAAWLASGNADRAFLLRGNGSYRFEHYGEIPLGETIDWSLGQPGKNNLSWQLHALPLIKDLLKAHQLDGDAWWLVRTADIICQWADANIVSEPPSIFSWNDHSTAFRLLTLANAFFYFRPLVRDHEALVRRLLDMGMRHQRVLLSEQFYSKGTNHGLDQAYALYQSTFFFGLLAGSGEVRETARNRLAFELAKSFSKEGVHVENSPEYHASILSSTLQINATATLLEGRSLLSDVDGFVNNALEYLAYVLRPDGKIPPIGDSLLAAPKQDFNWLARYGNFQEFDYARTGGLSGNDAADWHKVFPNSGYAVFRGDPAHFPVAERPHMVYKCGFLSHYHRQDDDNSVVLYALGQEWLADGGLYVHDHGVPEREYLRSHKAHNVMSPDGIIADRRNCPEPAPRIVDYSISPNDAWVKGETTIFPGFLCARTVGYDGLYEYRIEDEVTALAENRTVSQYWQVPAEHAVALADDRIAVFSRTSGVVMLITIESEALVGIEIANGKDGVLGVRSKSYGVLEPVTVIRVRYGNSPMNSSVRIRFATTPVPAMPRCPVEPT